MARELYCSLSTIGELVLYITMWVVCRAVRCDSVTFRLCAAWEQLQNIRSILSMCCASRVPEPRTGNRLFVRLLLKCLEQCSAETWIHVFICMWSGNYIITKPELGITIQLVFNNSTDKNRRKSKLLWCVQFYQLVEWYLFIYFVVIHQSD